MSLFLNIFKSFRTKRPEKRGRESASRCAVALVSFLCVLALAFSLVPPVFADEDPVEINLNEIQEVNQAENQGGDQEEDHSPEDKDTLAQEIRNKLEALSQQLQKLVELQKKNQLSTDQDADFAAINDAFLDLGKLQVEGQLSEEQVNTLKGLLELWQGLLEKQVQADQAKPEEPEEEPAEPENEPAQPESQVPNEDGSVLEIGPEIVPDSVGRGDIAAPTINKVFYDATTISGGGVIRSKVGGKVVRSTVYVKLTGADGTVKAENLSVTPTSGTTWKINLPKGVTVAEGDTVTAYQTLDGATSPEVTANAEPSMAYNNKTKLKMPSDEIWIEQTSSNLVNKDEHAEAIEMFNSVNSEIATDIQSVKFSIDGTDHAYYEVTYTDGSTSGKVEAPDLKIKTVTETSAAPTIEKVQVTDAQIIVTLSEEVAQGTKFYFVKKFTDGEDKNFCESGNCKVDKSTSQEMSQDVSVDGKKVTFQIKDDDLELKREFGIVVKEPHKFRSCAKSEPVVTTPEKVVVRDPKKLTDPEKDKIRAAIRTANTINGKSKLPDGTGFITDPAFIEFDKDGNVTIISPNDVEVDWDNDGNPIYQKNADGSYKLQSGKENNVYKFPAKDLVKNTKPNSPEITVYTETGKVTITPPDYTNPGDDTDLASYTITYKDASNTEKTLTLTRSVDGDGKTTWSSDGATVDEDSGMVTLQINDLAVGATITAKAKDNGGLISEETPLESDPASKILETVEVTYDANGGTGTMDAQKINKGVKIKLPANAFNPPAQKSFKGWKIGNQEYAPDAEITPPVNTNVEAVWQDKPATKVTLTFDPNGGNWDGETANKIFKEEKGKNFTIIPAPVKDGHKFLYWKGSEFKPGDNYLVEGDHTFVAQWEPSEIPYIVVPVHPTQTVVEPIGPVTQPTVQTTVTPTTPSPMVYTLPATGSVDASLTIWAGLGLALAGLLLKKRG